MAEDYASIQKFITTFSGGGARSNRYILDFTTWPSVVNPETGKKAREMGKVSCKSTSIPSDTIGTTEAKYMGRTIKYPGDRVFNDWTITCINDVSFDLRHAFEEWHEGMMGHASNIETGISISSFFGEAQVYQLNRSDEIIATYKMEKIWPAEVGEIQLSYDNDNTIEEFSVTFAVNQWTRIKS